jgi:hypothetical protein
MGLSAAGLSIPTGAELIDQMVAEYESLTGLTVDATRTDDQLVMILITILSEMLGDAYGNLQAVYDGKNADTSEGLQAEDAAYLVGVEPDPATLSTATVSLTGTTGVIVPKDSIVEGGGTEDDARWRISADTTIPADVAVTAEIAGPTTAAIGAIDAIVSGVPGWTGVTNAAAASPGELRETAAQLRRKRRLALQSSASSSSASIRAMLLQRDEVQEVAVIQNASAVAAVVSGKNMNPNSVWVFFTPDSITTAQEDDIAAALHQKVAAGTEMMNSGGGSAVTRDVTDRGGSTAREVSWDYGSDLLTTIQVAVNTLPGYVLADVEQGVRDALSDYMDNGIGMGDVLRAYNLTAAIACAGIEGILSIGGYIVTVGGLPAGLDITPGIDETFIIDDPVTDITVV